MATSKSASKTKAKSKASSKTKTKTTSSKSASKSKSAPSALDQLTALAADTPERLAELAPPLLERLRAKTHHAKAARTLLSVGSDEAVDLAIDLFLEGSKPFELALGKADEATRRAVWRRVVARRSVLNLTHYRIDGLCLAEALGDQDFPAELRATLAAALLDHADDLGDVMRTIAIHTLWATGDAETRDRLIRGHESIAFPLRARVLLGADPAVAYQQLAQDFRGSPDRRGAILDLLGTKADPRWAHEVLAFVADDPMASTQALVRLRAGDELCDLAARPDLDEVARCALHALGQLGDPRASQLLVEWLRSPIGQERAPFLLTALGSCGDPAAATYLEEQLEHAGSRRAFYQLALAEIRERYEDA